MDVNRIIHGDALDVLRGLPDASVDMIFTDPPYGHNNNNGDLIHRWEVALGKSELQQPRPIANDGAEADDVFQSVLPELARVLAPGGCCCCCCGDASGLGLQTRADFAASVREEPDVAQPRMGRAADGLPGGLDGHRFPAGPGPQHPWETPRQIVSRGPHWKHRIRALGNAVVPQVVYPFAVEIMRLLEAD